jgi:site-specific DNA-methyltransferase (adenine-specific)
MFPPSLPHYFIKRFTTKGATILDPFSGRGTTAVAAASLSRIGLCNDLNPLAVELSKGKLSNPNLSSVISRLDQLEQNYVPNDWNDLTNVEDRIRMIYHNSTLSQLLFLRNELDYSQQGVDSFITAILLGSLHGGSEGFLSVSMPNTFSMSENYIKSYIEREKLEKPNRDVFAVLRKRIQRVLVSGTLPGSGVVYHGDVRDLGKTIKPGSVNLLFTSPPYLKVIKYGLYNWIRLWYLGADSKQVDQTLDDTHSLDNYLEFMKDTLSATLPLIEPNKGFSCWVIGDVGDFNLAWAVWKLVGENIEVRDPNGHINRWKLLAIIDDKIPSNEKTTRLWKEKKGKATSVDRIMILAPESSNPKTVVSDPKMVWNVFER